MTFTKKMDIVFGVVMSIILLAPFYIPLVEYFITQRDKVENYDIKQIDVYKDTLLFSQFNVITDSINVYAFFKCDTLNFHVVRSECGKQKEYIIVVPSFEQDSLFKINAVSYQPPVVIMPSDFKLIKESSGYYSGFFTFKKNIIFVKNIKIFKENEKI